MALTIDLTDLDRLPVRFRVCPHGDATSAAADALGRFDLGGTHAQRTLVRAALADSPAAGLRILVHPTTTYVWDGLMPSIPYARRAYEDFGQVDQDLDAFCDDMELQYGGRPPERWRSVLARPRTFVDAYVRDCTAVRSAMRSRLGDPRPILDREAERVGAAVARGALPEMLASLLPGARLRGRRLVLPARRDKRLAIGSDGLVIVPMLASVRRASHVFRGTDLVSLGYPAPGIGHFFESRAITPPADGAHLLVALLGLPRATILRSLDRPASAGQIGAVLRVGPSGVSYHVDALLAAGLVERRRHGRYVLIARTARGDQLLDLYSR